MRSPIKRRLRSDERIRFHYDVERELADRLRAATKDERRELYRQCYDELFTRVSDHPQVVRKRREHEQVALVEQRLRRLRRFIRAGDTYLEIGAGDCRLAIRVCDLVAKCYALDVSEVITWQEVTPANFELIISDGTTVPVPAGSIDLAHSDQLMEHLHPEDAAEQLANIYRALKPGGRYLCRTPSRLTGPHDVSQYFDQTATGFHLKEYSYGDLLALMRAVGFRRFRVLLGWDRVVIPAWFARSIEWPFEALPRSLTRSLTKALLVRRLLGINMLAEK